MFLVALLLNYLETHLRITLEQGLLPEEFAVLVHFRKK